MNVESAELFFAILAILAAVIAVSAALPWLVTSWRTAVWETLEPIRLPLAAAITATAMVGSLYFSEVANFTPCTLCWYQRILMYPSAIILTIAAIRRDVHVRRYVLPLVGLGMLVSTYHYLVERFPDVFESSEVCKLGIPCSQVWFERFGFVSLPLMALVGFGATVSLLAIPITTPSASPAAPQEESA